MPTPPDHNLDQKGHRQRLRNRFMKGGRGALADYELLELILFSALPRGDVKPLAKALLRRFGSFAEIVSASPERLAEIKGVGSAVVIALKTIEAGVHHFLQDQVMHQPVIGSWDALIDYCQASMAYQKVEQFRILFLNAKNALIADEVQQRGTVNHTAVYPREVIRRALELHASAIILVHNHPSGDPTPSRDDIAMTKQIVEAGKSLGVDVHDHLVIGKHGHNSFKTLGLL